MTILAGADDLVESHMGIGVIHFLDIMRPVAVGALGRFQVSESVGFAVDGLGVGLRKVLMTTPALMGHLGHELVLFVLLDLMGGVTVFAVGQLCV